MGRAQGGQSAAPGARRGGQSDPFAGVLGAGRGTGAPPAGPLLTASIAAKAREVAEQTRAKPRFGATEDAATIIVFEHLAAMGEGGVYADGLPVVGQLSARFFEHAGLTDEDLSGANLDANARAAARRCEGREDYPASVQEYVERERGAEDGFFSDMLIGEFTHPVIQELKYTLAFDASPQNLPSPPPLEPLLRLERRFAKAMRCSEADCLAWDLPPRAIAGLVPEIDGERPSAYQIEAYIKGRSERGARRFFIECVAAGHTLKEVVQADFLSRWGSPSERERVRALCDELDETYRAALRSDHDER